MADYNYITEDNIEKTKKYKEAVDELQKSILGLNSKLPSFADGLKAGLQAVGEKLPEVVTSMINLNKQNKELAESGGKPVNILKQLASSMFSWNGLISIGVTLLATYGGALIDWVSDLLKGETRLTALGKSLKEHTILANAVTEARLRGAQAAQGELTGLDALYRATQNVKLSKMDQKKAMDALRDQWPETFKNLKDEAFKTGEAANAYKNLKDSILDAAYAEAYKNKITANAGRSIENDLKIAKERENNLKIVASEKEAQEVLSHYQKGNFNQSDRFVTQLTGAIERQSKLRAASDEIIYALSTDKDLLAKQNKKFAEETDKLVSKPHNGPAILTGGRSNYVSPDTTKKGTPANHDVVDHLAQESVLIFNEYDKQITTTNQHYEKLKAGKKLSAKQSEDLEKAHQAALNKIVASFRETDLDKLDQYQRKLAQIAIDSTVDARQQAILQAEEDKKLKLEDFDKEQADLKKRIEEEQTQLEALRQKGSEEQISALQDSVDKQNAVLDQAGKLRLTYETQLNNKILELKKDKPADDAVNENKTAETNEKGAVDKDNGKPREDSPIQQKITYLEKQYKIEIAAAEKVHKDTTDIAKKYNQQKLELETQLISSKIHAGDKFINAVLANSKKDSAIYKAAFLAKKATSVADTIISTRQAVIESFKAYSGIPFIGQALGIAQAAFMAAQGASSIATIIKQKPGYAQGGQFVSDGRGALLPGYSRTDNTNAYLRSGEAVVVSEAMRNPWARNLVSAINVAHGGRDFSMPNTGRGYAIGGIYTDGGNANRYYNQPVNDAKELANTLAYQMINNFPPIYVDVKDVNNQQNILAQTVNRVNL